MKDGSVEEEKKGRAEANEFDVDVDSLDYDSEQRQNDCSSDSANLQ